MLIGPLTGSSPLYKQIYDALRMKILRGELASGAALPGTRTLARDLGVSRIVVLTAYEQLTAEGYIEASVGAGSRVAAQVGDRLPPADGRPKPAAAPQMVSAYARRARRLSPQVPPGQEPADAKGV